MNKLKRFKIGLFTITLGMVLVGASFALADDKAVAEGIILPEELNETTAILTPSVAIAENEPTTQPEEWIDAVATAYCPCEICCGKWALNRPDGIVYTASGAIAEEGVTIAADWSVYSPGTILYIEGIGERTVQDRGGAISGQKIDVFFNNHEDALHFGRQEVRIKVISDTERQNDMEIKTLVAKAHENAVKHGFWEPPLAFGTAIALIHSELSEALEEERNGNPDVWFACNESDSFLTCAPQDETDCIMYGKENLCKYRSRKPEGVAVELADAVIRIADPCGHLGIDLEEVIEIKMAYNEGRPYKHGKKF